MPRSASWLELYPISDSESADFGATLPRECSPSIPSRNPADADRAVLVSAIEPGNPRLLHHHPAHPVALLQPQKVLSAQTLPRSLSQHLRPPLLSQRWKHANHAIVLDC